MPGYKVSAEPAVIRTLRMPRRLAQELDDVARTKEITSSELVRTAIRSYLKRRKLRQIAI